MLSKKGAQKTYSRSTVYHGAEYMLRFMSNLAPIFKYDLESMLIVLSVALGNIQPVMNSPELVERYDDIALLVPEEYQTPMSRLSITRSTGLPRETVRRKVAGLIETGHLIEDARRGVRIAPGLFINSEPFRNAIAANEIDLARLVRQLTRKREPAAPPAAPMAQAS
ncbi:MAG: hypothetical protein P4L64_07280 [Caulobacteraceae bacterium]|nr:hypothetical protein [Caulobacteraceae bacterium]